MYLVGNWYKVVLVILLVVGYGMVGNYLIRESLPEQVNSSTEQLTDSGQQLQRQTVDHELRNNGYALGWGVVVLVCFLVFLGDIRRLFKTVLALLVLLPLAGCYRPYEPVKLQTISNTEEAFLIPLVGDAKSQKSTNKETFLRENMVSVKQVKIPQQWIQTGYGTVSGHWEDAAMLIKVDTSPVTREWTADPNTGTSSKNEAVWCMTSDQIEFSTGWQCTARIANRDDAVRFLFNYPTGSLKEVLDTEVRGKLATTFGLEVTDLPMEELRKNATPHILKTVKMVTEFFKERGITITNLGITGGFIYKDKTMMDTMVKLFNAEQEKLVAAAATAAQGERNKRIQLEAKGAAEALLTAKKAEADGIRMVADAKSYEIARAADKLSAYLSLKQLEIQRDLLSKWDGAYPRYFMGGGSASNLLMQLPPVENSTAAKADR